MAAEGDAKRMLVQLLCQVPDFFCSFFILITVIIKIYFWPFCFQICCYGFYSNIQGWMHGLKSYQVAEAARIIL